MDFSAISELQGDPNPEAWQCVGVTILFIAFILVTPATFWYVLISGLIWLAMIGFFTWRAFEKESDWIHTWNQSHPKEQE